MKCCLRHPKYSEKNWVLMVNSVSQHRIWIGCQHLIWVCIVNAFLFVSPASSEELTHASVSQQEALVLDSLDDLAKQLSNTEILFSPFKQSRHLSILSRPLISHGTFLYQRDRHICWRVEKPVPAVIELTADSVSVSDATGVKSFDQSNPVLNHLSTLFFAIFSGDFEQLQSQFIIEWAKSKDEWIVALLPIEENISSFVQRFVIKGHAHITEVEMFQKGGDKTILFFEEPLINELAKDVSLECESGRG